MDFGGKLTKKIRGPGIPGRNLAERVTAERAHDESVQYQPNRTARKEFMLLEALPKQLMTYGCGIFRPFRLWCVGCDGGTVLAYIKMLENFRESLPHFKYHVMVSDSNSARIELTRKLVEESGGVNRPGGKIDLRIEYLENETLAIRKPQDVIICGQKLETLVGGSTKKVLSALCKLLFPGRYLVGEEDFVSKYGELPLSPVETGVFRRTG